ncbi:hypothetical protein C8250_013805 [Streptomyces sp. So13.3]|uniref:hypothetical protein n=1 Tax=Streptomyces TaxID=1883 RepID=UPI0011062B66|nr:MULTISPECIES: hypothetical protein [Streptomyces]MCZ4100947.1 hypothetical protein [Streptomyces sp. H39-C1]QNA72848.1 hypothetical protein C8250_013805 [Streptomyces sp. So13.3]
MSGIGPVEGPAGGTPSVNSLHPPVHWTDRWTDGRVGRWAGRWQVRRAALSDRGRRTVLAATAALATVAVLCLGHAMRTPEPVPDPGPWPAQVTYIAYESGHLQPMSAPASGVFGFVVSVRDGTPVTILRVTPSFEGLGAEIDPSTPLTVKQGTTRHITIKMIVRKCAGLPLDVDLPVIDVTLRNTRAIQNQSFIFGGGYPRDLSAFLHRICRPTPTSSSSTP